MEDEGQRKIYSDATNETLVFRKQLLILIALIAGFCGTFLVYYYVILIN